MFGNRFRGAGVVQPPIPQNVPGQMPTGTLPQPTVSPQARTQKLLNEENARSAAKTQNAEKEFRNMQLREGVAPNNLKPYSTTPPNSSQYGLVEPGDKLNVAESPLKKANYTPQVGTAPNLTSAMGQIKSGDQFGAQNTMRQAVGLPTIAPPPDIENPQLSDAIGRLKMGDRASAEAMMRKMVGLKKGGKVSSSSKGSSKGSSSSSASRRGDGIASKGKTRGRMV